MPIGAVIGFVLVGLMAVWAVIIFVRRAKERPTETSSHHESDAGMQGGGPSAD